MTEVSYPYLNQLASQIITICSLLAGFSIAIIANILVSSAKTRLIKWIMVISTMAASFFLISLFSMTRVMMMTTEGYPQVFQDSDLLIPRAVGVFSFLFGIITLIAMISMAGYTKSKKLGIVTTVIGIITLFTALYMTT